MRLTLRSSLLAIAAAFLAVLAFSTTGAGAQENNNAYVGNEVQSQSVLSSSAPASVKSATPQVQSSSLAFTGSDATTVALIGVVAVIAGGTILLVRRRSEA